jgi:hypothetical protein
MFSNLDPDPSIIKQNSKKNLNSYCFCFVLFYDFLSLTDINAPLKLNLKKNFVGVKHENCRIRIHWLEARILVYGSVPRCCGSTTLVIDARQIAFTDLSREI